MEIKDPIHVFNIKKQSDDRKTISNRLSEPTMIELKQFNQPENNSIESIDLEFKELPTIETEEIANENSSQSS